MSPGAGESPPSARVTDSNDTSGEACITVYNLRFHMEDFDDSNVLFSSQALLPGDPFTVTVRACNTAGVSPATGGVAPGIRTRIAPQTNASGTIIDVTGNINRGSGSCRTNIFSGTTNANARLGEQVCVRVNSNRIEGYSNGVGTTGNQDRTFCANVAEQSYLSIDNAGAWAGGSFDASDTGYGTSWCSVAGGSSANGFIRTVRRANVVGAYASLSTGATGSITAFASGHIVGTAFTNLLTFANQGTTGNFNSQGKCISNLGTYLSTDTAITGVSSLGNAFPGGSNRQQQYVRSGNLTINSPQTLQAGERITIIVEGDLNINENITYDPNYTVNDSDNIPILVFVVKGDINIRDNVTELDGIYMAIPNDVTSNGPGNRGNIDTCSNAGPSLSSTTCSNQLTVRGMFVANSIEFRRTHHGISGGNGGTEPAEVFQFNSEVYLARPFFVSLLEPSLSIQFTKDLPPVIN